MSPHCLRIRVECTNNDNWSAYTPVTCDKWNISQIFLQKNLKEMQLIKSICPVWTHPLLKKWHTPKWNATKYCIICISRREACVLAKETSGSGLNRLSNVLCWLQNIHGSSLLPRIYSVTNTKHWITYTFISRSEISLSATQETYTRELPYLVLVMEYTGREGGAPFIYFITILLRLTRRWQVIIFQVGKTTLCFSSHTYLLLITISSN